METTNDNATTLAIDQEYDDVVGTYQTTMKVKSHGSSGTIDAENSPSNQFGGMDVLYTIVVSMGSMVIVTVIAVLVICVIKRKRRRTLKKFSHVKTNAKTFGAGSTKRDRLNGIDFPTNEGIF